MLPSRSARVSPYPSHFHYLLLKVTPQLYQQVTDILPQAASCREPVSLWLVTADIFLAKIRYQFVHLDSLCTSRYWQQQNWVIKPDKESHSPEYWLPSSGTRERVAVGSWDSRRHQLLVSPCLTASPAATAPEPPTSESGFRCRWPQMGLGADWAVSCCCFAALLLQRSSCCRHWSLEEEENKALRLAMHEKGRTALPYRPSEMPKTRWVPHYFQKDIGMVCQMKGIQNHD